MPAELPGLGFTNFSNVEIDAETDSSGNEQIYLKHTDPDTGEITKTTVGKDGWSAEAINTERVSHGKTHGVRNINQLENAFNNLTAGDRIYIYQPDTPYRTTQWLSVDSDDVTVVGESKYARNGEPLIKAADDSNVGGIQVGKNSTPNRVLISNIGFDGNHPNQTSGVEHHGIDVQSVNDIKITNCYIERTHPYEYHGEGGNGISVLSATNAWITQNHINDAGDRAIEFGGENAIISQNHCENSWDRHIATIVDRYEDFSGTMAEQSRGVKVNISNNILGPSTEGSCIGVHGRNNNSDQYIITNNITYGEHNSAIVIMANSEAVSVIGNVCDGSLAREDAINIDIEDSDNDTTEGHFLIAQNLLFDYPQSGVETASGTYHAVIAFNDIWGCGGGFNIRGIEGQIIGNHVRGSTDSEGIRVLGSENLIAFNDVRGGQIPGIRADGGTGAANIFESNVVKGNRQNGNSGPEVTVLETESVFKSNVIENTIGGSALWDNQGNNTYHGNISLAGELDITAAPKSVESNSPPVVLSSPLANANIGNSYLDDGTNTTSGTLGKRVYDGSAWVDAWTA